MCRIDALGQGLAHRQHRFRRRTFGRTAEQRGLSETPLRHCGVLWHFAQVVDFAAGKAAGNLRQPLERDLAQARLIDAVHREMCQWVHSLTREALDERIGIRQRSDLRIRHDDDVLGSEHGDQRLRSDAGGTIEQHHVVTSRNLVQCPRQCLHVAPIELREARNARTTGNEIGPVGGRHQNLLQGNSAIEQVQERVSRIDSEQQMRVGEAEVAIDERHSLAASMQSDRSIRRQERLPRAALAAGECHDHTLSLSRRFRNRVATEPPPQEASLLPFRVQIWFQTHLENRDEVPPRSVSRAALGGATNSLAPRRSEPRRRR